MSGSVAFDRVAGSYDATRGGMERGRDVAAVLAGLLPADGPVLEVGVGTGLVAGGLAELGRPPLGVDLSLPMLARARERLPGRLAAGDALRLPVRDGAVAGAYLVHVLHLVADIPGTLAEVARVLRPGGTLVATAFPDERADGDLAYEMERIRVELGGTRRRTDAPLLLPVAAAAGFALTDRRALPGRGATPAQAVELLATRSLSWMWAVDDALWAERTPAALDRLRALPDQDAVRRGPGQELLALTRP